MAGMRSGDQLGLNERAARLADDAAARARELRIRWSKLEGGTRLLDFGVEAEGGLEAGRRLAEICMGGLGSVRISHTEIEGWWTPAVEVRTDHPAAACMAAQYAGWQIHPEGYFAMGSGPARAAAVAEEELFEKLGYRESPERGVLVLEAGELPSREVAAWVADRVGVTEASLTLAIARTASLAGSVQVCARSAETGMHQMVEQGFDVNRVVAAYGVAPLAPVASDDLRAIGRTNDAVLYGGRVHYTVDAEDDELEGLAASLPSRSSSDYGTPFFEIFERYDRDFYKIDGSLFSPAEVLLTSTRSGRSFLGGGVNVEVLRESLLG